MLGSTASSTLTIQAAPDTAAIDAVAKKESEARQLDEEIKALAERELELLASKQLTAEQYFAGKMRIEKEALERMNKHPELLSEGQKEFVAGVKQNHEFQDNVRHAATEYKGDKNNPDKKAAYIKELEQRRDLTEVLGDSKEFKGNPHLAKIVQLEKDAIEAVKAGKSDQAIQREIFVEARAWKVSMAADPEGDKKMASFVEKNKDNPKAKQILEASGVVKIADGMKKMDKDHEIASTEHKPDKAARTGAVSYKDDKGNAVTVTTGIDGEKYASQNGKVLTNGVVMAEHDDGTGKKETKTYEVDRSDGHMKPPTTTPNVPGAEKTGPSK